MICRIRRRRHERKGRACPSPHPTAGLLFLFGRLLVTTLVVFVGGVKHVDAFSSSSKPSPNAKSDMNNNNNNNTPFRQLKITFVTGNAMKAKEVERILARHGATKGPDPTTSLVDLRILSVDLPELQEVDTAAIAKNKALLAAQLANGPCLVEDTSLHFHALGGMPGPYIKWFQDSLQSTGLYNILAAYEDKQATAVCTLAFCPSPHADPVLFEGECHGQIVAPVPGRGFGWDSIFVPTAFAKSGNGDMPFSQMSVEEKNEHSHRGKAVRQWADWLGRNRDALWERQERKEHIPGHKGLDFSVDFSEQ